MAVSSPGTTAYCWQVASGAIQLPWKRLRSQLPC